MKRTTTMSNGNGGGNGTAATVRANMMLVATRDFSATLDGEQIHLRAGLGRVGGDHELAERFPEISSRWRGGPHGERSIRHRKVEHGVPRASTVRSLEQELHIRTQRLADLDRRERARPVPPDSSDRFWAKVDRDLESAFPDIARQRRGDAAEATIELPQVAGAESWRL
jgi:hypothetical protein